MLDISPQAILKRLESGRFVLGERVNPNKSQQHYKQAKIAYHWKTGQKNTYADAMAHVEAGFLAGFVPAEHGWLVFDVDGWTDRMGLVHVDPEPLLVKLRARGIAHCAIQNLRSSKWAVLVNYQSGAVRSGNWLCERRECAGQIRYGSGYSIIHNWAQLINGWQPGRAMTDADIPRLIRQGVSLGRQRRAKQKPGASIEEVVVDENLSGAHPRNTKAGGYVYGHRIIQLNADVWYATLRGDAPQFYARKAIRAAVDFEPRDDWIKEVARAVKTTTLRANTWKDKCLRAATNAKMPKGMTKSFRKVYAAMLSFAQRTSTCWAAKRTLAAAAKVSIRTVTYAWRFMESRKLIKLKGQRRNNKLANLSKTWGRTRQYIFLKGAFAPKVVSALISTVSDLVASLDPSSPVLPAFSVAPSSGPGPANRDRQRSSAAERTLSTEQKRARQSSASPGKTVRVRLTYDNVEDVIAEDKIAESIDTWLEASSDGRKTRRPARRGIAYRLLNEFGRGNVWLVYGAAARA